MAILERALGPDHPGTALCLANGAEIMNAKHRWREAVEMAEPAIAILAREWGSEHPELAYPLTSLGIALTELGRAEQALPPLERALALRVSKAVEPEFLGETRFALAPALWKVGRSPERAHRLVDLAAADFARAQGSSAKNGSLEVERWRSARWPSSGDAPKAAGRATVTAARNRTRW